MQEATHDAQSVADAVDDSADSRPAPWLAAALTLAVLSATLVSVDGESNWLEGAQLLAVYLIVALGFYFTGTVAPHT